MTLMVWNREGKMREKFFKGVTKLTEMINMVKSRECEVESLLFTINKVIKDAGYVVIKVPKERRDYVSMTVYSLGNGFSVPDDDYLLIKMEFDLLYDEIRIWPEIDVSKVLFDRRKEVADTVRKLLELVKGGKLRDYVMKAVLRKIEEKIKDNKREAKVYEDMASRLRSVMRAYSEVLISHGI